MIIGTCSNCGGPVCLPEMWGGIVPPDGQCLDCGSIAKRDYGRIIKTEKPRYESPFKNMK